MFAGGQIIEGDSIGTHASDQANNVKFIGEVGIPLVYKRMYHFKALVSPRTAAGTKNVAEVLDVDKRGKFQSHFIKGILLE